MLDATGSQPGQFAATRIGLGLAALGRPGYITLGHADDLHRDYTVPAMRAHAWSVLDAAYAAGIRYFDAARSYGCAEEFLADWLADRTPQGVSVGSKWGYTYTASWSVAADTHEVKDHTLPTLRRQWAETQAEIGQWLSLYQIHSATEASGVLDRDDVLDELARLRDDLPIEIGLTVSGPDSRQTVERALTIERDGTRLFTCVQATWNILEPSLSITLAEAHAQGVRVIIKEALANGRLTERNDDPAFAETRAMLERAAARLNCTLDQLALAATLDQPWAQRVLSGAATVDHLRSNVGALDVRLDDAARTMLRGIAESPATYWETRGRLAWN